MASRSVGGPCASLDFAGVFRARARSTLRRRNEGIGAPSHTGAAKARGHVLVDAEGLVPIGEPGDQRRAVPVVVVPLTAVRSLGKSNRRLRPAVVPACAQIQRQQTHTGTILIP
jgi:hypothetical protein